MHPRLCSPSSSVLSSDKVFLAEVRARILEDHLSHPVFIQIALQNLVLPIPGMEGVEVGARRQDIKMSILALRTQYILSVKICISYFRFFPDQEQSILIYNVS